LINEISGGVQVALRSQRQWNLQSSKVISSNLLINRDLPHTVKNEIKEFQFNCKCIVMATAEFIEQYHYKSVDEVVNSMHLIEYDKERVRSIVDSQKKIGLSFQTLNIIIELFTRVNDKLKEEIDNAESREENLTARLKNAILVYELLNFIHDYIEEFSLNGKEDLNAIKTIIFEDIARGELEQEELKLKLQATKKLDTKNNIEKQMKNRQAIWKIMKARWKGVDNKIKSIEAQILDIKEILPDLDAYRLDAKMQIDILSLTAIMNVLETNVEIIKNLKHLNWNYLVSFRRKTIMN